VVTDLVSVDLAKSIIISVFVENNLHILLFLLSIYIKQTSITTCEYKSLSTTNVS